MKDKIFNLLKSLYKKMPINYKMKNKLKGVFYRTFGFLFKNTTSYRVWNSINTKAQITETISVDKKKLAAFRFEKKLAVQIHLFYVDLLDEFEKYLKNIPFSFDVLVSVVDKKYVKTVEERLKTIKNANGVYVETVKNQGRDVAPFISTFGKKIMEYDYVMHIHSKKSLFTGGEQTEWRIYLLDSLMGSEEIIKSNMYILENGENVGMVYPETFYKMPYYGHTWLRNKQSRDELLTRIGVNVKSKDIYIDYPMGTMFIARVNAIKEFFSANIKTEEFAKEAGQTDGTIAHAFERCLNLISANNGYNSVIYDKEADTYSYNYGNKNMGQYMVKSYEHMKNEIENYDVVSFDIFDTLLQRVISDTDAIQKLVEKRLNIHFGEETEFAKIRELAEIECRRKHPDRDCDIDDIYMEMSKQTGWTKEKTEYAKKTELETEISLIRPKTEMIEVLKYTKHTLGKKVYLISDMHLRKKDILWMLDICKVKEEDFDEFLLSSEIDKRKDNGTMWEHYVSLEKGKRCIHIGDNEVSDVQIPEMYNIANYHILSPNALFELSDLGKTLGNINDGKAETAVELGIIQNKIYNNPFRYNNTDLKVVANNGYEFGYAVMGPVCLNYVLWLIKEARMLKSKKILFFSREGYVLYKLYESLMPYIDEKTDAEYVYVSRRALAVASILNEEDIEAPLDIYYEGKLSNLMEKRYGINIKDQRDEDIKLPDNKAKVLKYIQPYKNEIQKKAKSERENYKKYMLKVLENIDDKESVTVADIGYSGTIQYYLSKVQNRGFDGRYMATDEKKKPLQLDGNTIKGFYIDNDSEQELSKSNIHRYHLLLESILIAPDGQLTGINENMEPVFEEKNLLYDKNIEEIHKGITDYAKEYAKIMGDILSEDFADVSVAEGLINACVKTGIVSDDLKNSLAVDDKFCSGEVKNAIEHYKNRQNI